MLMTRRRCIALALAVGAAALAPREAQASDCTRTSTGLPVLEDLGTGTYLGQQGGLYPDGTNVPPAEYRQRGVKAGASIKPIRGKIGLLSIGMSNTSMIFSAFSPKLSADPRVSAAVTPVLGAQGGHGLEDWISPSSPVWAVVDERIAGRGLRADQIQAIWWSHAAESPAAVFPEDAQAQLSMFRQILPQLRNRFKNLRQIHLSDINYLGYVDPSSPRYAVAEPQTGHDNSWAVKWLVADGVDGTTTPWLGWGPRQWTDGLAGRGDGLVWECGDAAADGVHPSSASGQEKLAVRLLNFYLTDPTTAWFRA